MAKNVELSNHSQARQQQLLAAALTVVARRGLSGITVNDIADEAGCSYGVIAFHFKTKERLLLEALNFWPATMKIFGEKRSVTLRKIRRAVCSFSLMLTLIHASQNPLSGGMDGILGRGFTRSGLPQAVP